MLATSFFTIHIFCIVEAGAQRLLPFRATPRVVSAQQAVTVAVTVRVRPARDVVVCLAFLFALVFVRRVHRLVGKRQVLAHFRLEFTARRICKKEVLQMYFLLLLTKYYVRVSVIGHISI